MISSRPFWRKQHRVGRLWYFNGRSDQRIVLSPIHLNQHEGLNVALQTIISTLIVLVTGEFLPKTLFKINPNRMLKIFAVPAFIIYILLYPVSKFTSALSRGILRLMGLKVNKKASEQAFTKIDLDNLYNPVSNRLKMKTTLRMKSRYSKMPYTSRKSRYGTVWYHGQK